MIKNDFETILEVEKQYKNKIENLTEEQWMDLTHTNLWIQSILMRIILEYDEGWENNLLVNY